VPVALKLFQQSRIEENFMSTPAQDRFPSNVMSPSADEASTGLKPATLSRLTSLIDQTSRQRAQERDADVSRARVKSHDALALAMLDSAAGC
jgi:hypothetical protein